MSGEDYEAHLRTIGDLPVILINGEIDFREAVSFTYAFLPITSSSNLSCWSGNEMVERL